MGNLPPSFYSYIIIYVIDLDICDLNKQQSRVLVLLKNSNDCKLFLEFLLGSRYVSQSCQ